MRLIRFLIDKWKNSQRLRQEKQVCQDYYALLRGIEAGKLAPRPSVGELQDATFLERRRELRRLRLWLELQADLDRADTESPKDS